MRDRLRFYLNRIGERLWVKPLLMCMISIVWVFVAKAADHLGLGTIVPHISKTSIETLLGIISSSMLVIATFAVASMVSAYASASTTATPRTFSLVISDDVSKNALSKFIGAFIFSIVSLIAVQNDYYDKAGYFAIFALTLTVLAIVIFTFVRWVDSIARLGRLGSTITKAEAATATSIQRRRCAPTLRGVPVWPRQEHALAIYGTTIGYVQLIDTAALQALAEKMHSRISIEALPGTFSGPGRVLAYVSTQPGEQSDIDTSTVDTSEFAKAFLIQEKRTFDEDPRFGFIVLSEIASRALSPAVNDPGTAIDVIGSMVRLFALWSTPIAEDEKRSIVYDRVAVPEISLKDLFDDAFTPIARDGAGIIEVGIRLQKAFQALACTGDSNMRKQAMEHGLLALARARIALDLPEDLATLKKVAKFHDYTPKRLP